MTNNNKPYMTAFLQSWKLHLEQENKEDFYEVIERSQNAFEVDSMMHIARNFIDTYMNTILVSNKDRNKLILEYGFKQLIDIMCEREGNAICEDLLNFDKEKSWWVYILLCNLLNLY